jgi:hypothetical protein
MDVVKKRSLEKEKERMGLAEQIECAKTLKQETDMCLTTMKSSVL